MEVIVRVLWRGVMYEKTSSLSSVGSEAHLLANLVSSGSMVFSVSGRVWKSFSKVVAVCVEDRREGEDQTKL